MRRTALERICALGGTPTRKTKPNKIQWTATSEERLIIDQIAKRAIILAGAEHIDYKYQECEMDLEACHCNGCPLDLRKMLFAPLGDFGHDIFGIRRYLNRRTGQLEDCFLPRCALPANKKAG